MSVAAPLDAVRRLAVPWPTAAVLGVLLAYATGFWLTSLQGAVGAIANAQSPFTNWLLHSTLMLPVFMAAVVAALALARRSGTAATGLLVAATATVVGILQVTASAVYDYRLQVTEIDQSRASHFHPVTPDLSTPCDSVCVAKGLTLGADVRGVLLIAGVLLVTNLVLVGWVAALGGGRLGARRSSPPMGTAAR